MNIRMMRIINLVIWTIVAIILYRQVVPLANLVKNFPLNDFSVYIDGTKATLNGKNPYIVKFFDRYNYSPAATLFFVPLVFLPRELSEWLFTVLSVVSLWLTISWTLKILDWKPGRLVKWLIFALSLKMFPVKLTLILGQINLIILALIVGSFYFLYRVGKGETFSEKVSPFEALSGILLGLATVIKLTPAPLVVYFLFRKKWKTVLWFMGTIAVLTLTGVAVFGWDLTYYYYFKTIPQLMSENTPATLNRSYMNQSVTALLGKFGIFGEKNSIIRLGISLGLGINIINVIKVIKKEERKKGFIAFWNLVVITMLFLPVFVWQHHYTVLIPLWIILTAKFTETKKIKDLAISGLTYFLLIFYIKDPYLPAQLNPFLSGHFLTTAIILLILSFYAMGSDQKQISDRKQFLK